MVNAPETKALAEQMHEAISAVALNHPQARVAAALVRICAAILPECAQGGRQSDALRLAADLLYAVAEKRDAEQQQH